MHISEWLRACESRLEAAECPDAQIDARWMAEDALHMTRTQLKFESARELRPEELNTLNAMLSRRVSGEPIQYILGHGSFMGLDFKVDERVLIPRQDTETLVESALVALKGYKSPKVLDLCTGSGAIGLSIKTLCPKADVMITDISKGALEVASANARALGAQVSVRHGDLFDAVRRERFDMIVSNPPYVCRMDLSELQREVRREPLLALDGGADGLDFYRRIAEAAGGHLNAAGCIYLEVGIWQAEQVLMLLKEHLPCAESGIIRDLCGIDRVVWAKIQGDKTT